MSAGKKGAVAIHVSDILKKGSEHAGTPPRPNVSLDFMQALSPAPFDSPDLFGTPDIAFADGRAIARTLVTSGADDASRLSLARGFCARVVSIYWSAVRYMPAMRGVPPEVALASLTDSACAVAADLGMAAARISPERAFYEIGRIYNTMIPEAFRACYGVYYTPPELADRLLDQATAAGVDWRNCRVLDPACGGGAFLAPVLRRMLPSLRGLPPVMVPGHLADRISGFEIDPFAAWLSLVAADAVLCESGCAPGWLSPDCVEVCDTLARPSPQQAHDRRWDLVIGNPPYGRVGLSTDQRERFRRSLYGHANLYGLFTDLALRYAEQGGIVAFVTPTSFLAGNYFKNLRGLLAAEAPPVSLDFVGARKGVFDDVLQETLLSVFRKDGTHRAARASTLSHRADGALQVSPAGLFTLPARPSDPWLVPRTRAQDALLGAAAKLHVRLRDWGYRVSTGPLVWNRHKSQLSAGPAPECLPLIWAEAVAGDGRFRFRAAKRQHLPWFRIRDSRDHWPIVRRPCVLVQRTTAKEQVRRLIAAELPEDFLIEHGGVVVENHLNMVRPIQKHTPAVSVAAVAALLNSSAVDAVFRCISGSVAVSAFELEALPLPSPTALGRLEMLVANGADIGSIETECARLYGMARP